MWDEVPLSLGNLFATYCAASPVENFTSTSLTVILFVFFFLILSSSQPADLSGYVLEMAGDEMGEFEGVLGQYSDQTVAQNATGYVENRKLEKLNTLSCILRYPYKTEIFLSYSLLLHGSVGACG